MSLHLTDQQFIERLYGLAGDDGHLESCPECRARWDRIQACRDAAASTSPLPAEFFQHQRRRIQDRLAAKPVPVLGRMWVPATLAIALMAGLVITRSVPEPSVPGPSESVETIEAARFDDIYSAARELEPRATSPIRRLFEEGPVLE